MCTSCLLHLLMLLDWLLLLLTFLLWINMAHVNSSNSSIRRCKKRLFTWWTWATSSASMTSGKGSFPEWSLTTVMSSFLFTSCSVFSSTSYFISAVKCNDSQMVLEVLASLGTSFDCASKVTYYSALNFECKLTDVKFFRPKSPRFSNLVWTQAKSSLLTQSNKRLTSAMQLTPAFPPWLLTTKPSCTKSSLSTQMQSTALVSSSFLNINDFLFTGWWSVLDAMRLQPSAPWEWSLALRSTMPSNCSKLRTPLVWMSSESASTWALDAQTRRSSAAPSRPLSESSTRPRALASTTSACSTLAGDSLETKGPLLTRYYICFQFVDFGSKHHAFSDCRCGQQCPGWVFPWRMRRTRDCWAWPFLCGLRLHSGLFDPFQAPGEEYWWDPLLHVLHQWWRLWKLQLPALWSRSSYTQSP